VRWTQVQILPLILLYICRAICKNRLFPSQRKSPGSKFQMCWSETQGSDLSLAVFDQPV
jgi:hypothetical protein